MKQLPYLPRRRPPLSGEFLFYVDGLDRPPIIVPNRVVNEGKDVLLKMMWQGDGSVVAAGGNYYVGLCNQAPASDGSDTLLTISTEVPVAHNYARIALTRDAVGFPTITTVNGKKVIQSKVITFSASGGDFNSAFTRAFLCTSASGSGGKLISFSGALSAALTLLSGQSFPMQYQFYFDP